MTKHAQEIHRTDDLTLSHRSATEVRFPDQVQALKMLLGPKLLAFTLDVNASTIERWINGGTAPASVEKEQRVRACFQVYQLLKPVEDPPTIRAWFMGMNPQLNDLSPAEAVNEGQLREVLMAARAFKVGG